MPLSLKDFLGYQQLGKVIQATKPGIPDVLPKGFRPARTETAITDQLTYNIKYGQRRLPKTATYGSPSTTSDRLKIGQRTVQMIHFCENIPFGKEIYDLLHSFSSYAVQEKAIELISYEVAAFRQKFDNARIASTVSALANGKLYFDANRDMLPTASGAVETVDLRVPAANIDTIANLSALAGQTAIAGTWSTTTTNIPGQIRSVMNACRRLTGYEIGMCIYGRNVPEYISQNTILNPFEVRSQSFREAYLSQGELPPAYVFQQLEWYPGYASFFERPDGTTPDLVQPNQVIFVPKPTDEWFGFGEGHYPVPTSLQPFADPVAALGSVKMVKGMFAYSTITVDPIGIKVVMGDTQLPFFRVPNVVFIATVA